MSQSKPTMSNRRRVGMLLRVTRHADRGLLVLIVVTLVLSAIAGALQSLGLKVVVDSVFDHDYARAVLAALVAALGAGLVGSAGRAMSDATTSANALTSCLPMLRATSAGATPHLASDSSAYRSRCTLTTPN